MTKEQVSLISVGANFGLGLIKLGLGLGFRISALVAEGIHSVTDVVSSLITWLGIRVAKRKPTKTHPYGWARAEVLAGFLVTMFLVIAGGGIVWEAIQSLIKDQHQGQIKPIVLVVMVFSVLVNEVLARLKIKVGQRELSLALIADGKHSRVDVYSSAGVFFGLVFASFWPPADGITALLVGLFILSETWTFGREVADNLLDVADLDVEKEIKRLCRQQEIKVMNIKSRKIGSLVVAELQVSLPVAVKLSRANELLRELEQVLLEKIDSLESVVIQLRGSGQRVKMVRGKCAEAEEIIGPEKKGRRVIIPYRQGKPHPDFGAPEYLVRDYQGRKVVWRQIIKNPYYKIGRGHGVRFAQAVGADEVRAKDIGANAKKALGKLKIEVVE